jgi:hypothetical protein
MIMNSHASREDSAFGDVSEADIDFGTPVPDDYAENSYSAHGFAERDALEDDDRLVPGNFLAATLTSPTFAAPVTASPDPVPPTPTAPVHAYQPHHTTQPPTMSALLEQFGDAHIPPPFTATPPIQGTSTDHPTVPAVTAPTASTTTTTTTPTSRTRTRKKQLIIGAIITAALATATTLLILTGALPTP